MSLTEPNFVVESPDGLRPAEFHTSYHFKLPHDTPVYCRQRRISSLLDNVEEAKILKVLSGGIITCASSAWPSQL